MYEWNRLSGRRTGGFGAFWLGAGAPEPNEIPLGSSAVFAFWPKSEMDRAVRSSLDLGLLEAAGRVAMREKALVCGANLEACEHCRHTKDAADRMAGSIARIEVLAIETWWI